MIKRAVDALPLDELDLIIVENVGNLVCPTEFDLGENAKVMILSVPEGHDKPYKYPGIFQISEAVILNKVDTMPFFDFDEEEFTGVVRSLNPTAPIFRIAATKGEGVDEWAEWLAARIERCEGAGREPRRDRARRGVRARHRAHPAAQPRQPLRRDRDHHGGARRAPRRSPRPTSTRWALAGLLHDLDYAETAEDPARHGLVTAERARRARSTTRCSTRSSRTPTRRRASRRWTRRCGAPTRRPGFIVAAALVRPDKDLAGVEVQSLTKRWKEKAFARGASREQMAGCARPRSEREEFLALALAAMQARAAEIGL